MASVNDYLIQLQKLTKTNLDILSAINDSLTADKTHVNIKVGEKSFSLPSLIYLENKINYLNDNFNNLINAPKTGEAYFNMDGNSRAIEVREYTCTPNSLKLNEPQTFDTYNNSVFKDFLTPVPYVKFFLNEIPNDIVSVNVKKVIPHNQTLINYFYDSLAYEENNETKHKKSSSLNWSDLNKVLAIYENGVDYTEYDKTYKLPIRKNIGSGTYVIESIVSDVVDENLDNYITLKLRTDLTDSIYRNNLTYKLFDDSISKNLKIGDELVTFDDSAKMVITEIRSATNTIVIKVLNGEYLNLMASPTEQGEYINDLSKIKFYSPIDFDADKYINIPLEEDQYVFIAIAPLNDRMNIQAGWGAGVIVDTYSLLNDNNQSFKEYYDINVKNLGDVLNELTSIMGRSSITKMDMFTFDALVKAKPIISSNNIKVVQINNHLNDSETAKNIRSLYTQKKQLNTELTDVQNSILEINDKLANISFDDTTNMRSVYTSQLTEYNKRRNDIVASITKITDAIAVTANNSDIPIESAKYHIRGYFDYTTFANNAKIDPSHVKGIRVQYRYKNPSSINAKAYSIDDGKFLYSDWNIMEGFDNSLSPTNNNGNFDFIPGGNTDNQNVPSFNQIDIPISQGEVVDIKLKVLYDYGYPMAEMYSDWSDILSVTFPDEFLKNVEILDIITENNNDIETNRFNNIIEEQGIPGHINDKVTDQDITYFHKPESIASGFYTSERRIIPLKDKLSELDSILTTLKDEVYGTQSESIDVTISNGDVNNQIFPFQDNNIIVESYSSIANNTEDNQSIKSGVYTYDSATGIVSTILNIVIYNNSNHTVKLFPMFVGGLDIPINDLTSSKYSITDYCGGQNTETGIFIKHNYAGVGDNPFKLQTAGQYLTFRMNNPFSGERYYGSMGGGASIQMPYDSVGMGNGIGDEGSFLYPIVRSKYGLCISNKGDQYLAITPGNSINIPIYFEYKFADDGKLSTSSKTMSFDLRTSLYSDPINYTFSVTAKKINTVIDNLLTTNMKLNKNSFIKYNPTVSKWT